MDRSEAEEYRRELVAFCAGVLEAALVRAGAGADVDKLDALGWATVTKCWIGHGAAAAPERSHLTLREPGTGAEHVINVASVELACQRINAGAVAGLTPAMRRPLLLAYFARDPGHITPALADVILQVAVFDEVPYPPAG